MAPLGGLCPSVGLFRSVLHRGAVVALRGGKQERVFCDLARPIAAHGDDPILARAVQFNAFPFGVAGLSKEDDAVLVILVGNHFGLGLHVLAVKSQRALELAHDRVQWRFAVGRPSRNGNRQGRQRACGQNHNFAKHDGLPGKRFTG